MSIAVAVPSVKVRPRRTRSAMPVVDLDGSDTGFTGDLAEDVADALAGLAGTPKRSRAGVLAEARSRVADALSLLDDEISDTDDTSTPDAAAKVAAAVGVAGAAATGTTTATGTATVKVKAEPVIRPNGEAYRPRTLAGRTDVEALRTLREAGVNVLLSGAPGCGKTALLEAAYGTDLVTFPGHGDAVVEELIGSWRPITGGGYAWSDGPLVVAMEQGKVLFVDDATLTPSTVLARMYPAMDGRGEIVVREQDPGRIVKAAPGFAVVGAHNPGVPGAVLSEALASRFNLTVEVGTDYALAKEMGVDIRVVRASAYLDGLRRTEQISWAPQMRELLAYKRIAGILGDEAAVGNLMACAPEDAREILAGRLTWVTEAAPLGLGDRA